MKFIHTGDIHWGMTPDADKPWSRERNRDIRETFSSIVQSAGQQKADFLFIAGDLFHRRPLMQDLKEVNYLFSTIPQTNVVLIAGNHDYLSPNSSVLSFPWNPNVFILDRDTPCSVCFPDKRTQVTGFSYHSTEITEARLNQIKAPDDGQIHILLGHGGDAKHVPIHLNSLADSGFSYIALGHIHKPEILLPKKAAFCGSPEPLDKTETGRHGFFLGEIDEQSGSVTDLKFIPAARRRYISLAVNVTPSTTNMELSQKIEAEVKRRGTEHIYRFRLKGMRDPDTVFDLESLTSRCRISDITDETEPQYDFNTLLSEHSGDMIGFYIQALKKPDMTEEEKKALYYGIHALLLTKDERS